MATLTADQDGKIRGKFTIPAGVPAGTKSVLFTSAGGVQAEAQYTGEGIHKDVLRRVVTRTTRTGYDPLAETFTLDESTQIAGIDLWFTACGGPVTVQMREVSNGHLSRTVIGTAYKAKDDVVVSGGGHTRFLFKTPVHIPAGQEYGFAVLADDPITACAIAELGKFDPVQQRYATTQPYQVGVLFSSSNNSSWTAHQNMDLAFRLLRARYTAETEMVQIGNAQLTNATDLVLAALAEEPGAQTRAEYQLELPGGESVNVSAGQPVRLAEKTTGQLAIKARVSGDSQLSPVLWPGTQVISATVNLEDNYVSRSIPATGGKKILLLVDGLIPSGSSVSFNYRADGGDWTPMVAGGSTPMDEGFREYIYSSAINNVDEIKVQIELNGTPAARPRLRNLRVMVI